MGRVPEQRSVASAPAHVSQRLQHGPPFAWQLPSIMWKHIYTGAMGSTYFALVMGMFLVAYGRGIGIGYRAWGVLGGLASFAVALQLVGAHLSSRLGHRRSLWFAFAMGERLVRGLAVVAAYWLAGVDGAVVSVAFVALLSIGSAMGALATPPWYSWLADLIPADQQGTFWGRRESWIALATTLVLLPCALFYDRAKAAGLAVPALLAVFALGLLLGYLDLFIHRTIPEPPVKADRDVRLGREIAQVLRDRGFRPWLVFACAWNFSMMIGASMCGVYFVDDLFTDSFTMGILAVTILPLMTQVLTSRQMGRLVDRFGTRRALAWGHVAWSLAPLPWLFATPSTAIWWLGASSAVVMPAASAAVNAATKYVTRFPAPEDRAMYWAVANSLGSFAGGLGSILAGEVLEALKGPAARCSFAAFQVIFIMSICLRLASVLLIRRLPALECERRLVVPGPASARRAAA